VHSGSAGGGIVPASRRLSPALAALVAVLVAGALAVPVIARQWRGSDTAVHLEWARQICSGEVSPLGGARLEPHVLYPWLLCAALEATPGRDLKTAAYAVAIASWMAAAAAVLAARRAVLGPPDGPAAVQAEVGVTILLLLVSPISLLVARNLYFGFVPLIAYHNPTVQLLRPLAIALFALVAPLSARRAPGASWPHAAALSSVTVLGTFAKPSFVVALLPALACAAVVPPSTPVWTPARKSLFAWVGLPAIACLAVQAVLFFHSASVSWAPLEVERALLRLGDPAVGAVGLGPRFLVSVAFPLAVLVSFGREAWRDPALRLAWFTFAWGAALAYLVAENGERRYHGNFTWSAQVALLVLFVQSTLFLAAAHRKASAATARARARRALCWGVFGLHAASGLLWYGVNVADLRALGQAALY